MKVNIEKNTQRVLGISALLLSLIYIFVSLGKDSWVKYVAGVAGIGLAIVLYSESAIVTYFQRKSYKKISIGDFIVWASILTGTGVLINSVLVFNQAKLLAPVWLMQFSTTTAVIMGTVGIILAIIHIVSPRYE